MIRLPERATLRRTETTIQGEIRLALSRVPGVIIFRNNVGALRDETGRMVRYGLADGSSDLIACAWGRFVAIEVKREQPRGKPSVHLVTQLAFIAQVERAGGVGGIAWDVPSAMAILMRAKP